MNTNINSNEEKQHQALIKIKTFADAYFNSSNYEISADKDVFDPFNHIYSIDSIMGQLNSIVHEGLGLPIPAPPWNKDKDKRENDSSN